METQGQVQDEIENQKQGDRFVNILKHFRQQSCPIIRHGEPSSVHAEFSFNQTTELFLNICSRVLFDILFSLQLTVYSELKWQAIDHVQYQAPHKPLTKCREVSLYSFKTTQLLISLNSFLQDERVQLISEVTSLGGRKTCICLVCFGSSPPVSNQQICFSLQLIGHH